MPESAILEGSRDGGSNLYARLCSIRSGGVMPHEGRQPIRFPHRALEAGGRERLAVQRASCNPDNA